MNTTTYRTTSILLILSVVFSTFSLAAAQSPQQLASSAVQAVATTDTTLDLCMYNEPFTLYYYGADTTLAQTLVLSAIYDGPVDTRTYAYQPVIFESVPTLDNGKAILAPVSVSEGNLIVDSAGDVVELTEGVSYLPAGCYNPSCAATYVSGTVAMEHMTVTHTLLADLKWSDGAPLTSADMIYSFNLDADPETPSSNLRVERTASYHATSPSQTEWTGLPGFFPTDYPVYYWRPMPVHAWGSYSAAELDTLELSNRTPLGWGPYVIDEWVAGSHISMHKNPNYFRAAEGLPHFDTLVVHFGTDLLGMLDGTCDVVVQSGEDLQTLLNFDDDGLFEVDVSESTFWEHLDFGIQSADAYTGFAALSGAFQDVRVRQAFAYCIDRQAITDGVYYGLGEKTNALIPDDHPYFPADAVIYPYDPAQGRDLLIAAGWTDSNANGIRDKDGVEFSVSLQTTNAPLRNTAASMIATQMADCGVEVTPVYLSAGELFAGWPDGPVYGRQFDLAEFAWGSDWLPSCSLYSSWNIPSDDNPGGQNDPGYSNPIYDAECYTAQSSFTEASRVENYGAVVRLFTEELPVLPLFMRLNIGIAATHITGFTLDPTDNSFWSIEELRVGVTEDIPVEGGELLSPEDTTTYTFDADTFSEEVTVTHVPLSPVDVPSFEDLRSAGHTYSAEAMLEDVLVDPALPYTVVIEYTDSEVGGILEDTLALYYWDGDSWEPEPTSVLDIDANTLTATPDHFSYWAVLGEPSTFFTFIPVVRKY